MNDNESIGFDSEDRKAYTFVIGEEIREGELLLTIPPQWGVDVHLNGLALRNGSDIVLSKDTGEVKVKGLPFLPGDLVWVLAFKENGRENKMTQKAKWKDRTSYSQGERGKVEPRTWDLDLELLTIIITRVFEAKGLWSDTWFLNCRELNISQYDLQMGDLEKAKRIAIDYARFRVSKYRLILETI